MKTQDCFILEGAKRTIWNPSFWKNFRRTRNVIFRRSLIINLKNEPVYIYLLVFAHIVTHVFEVLGCYWHFCACQEKRRLPIDEIEKVLKSREYDECRRKLLLVSCLTVCETWECDWWKLAKNNVNRAGDFEHHISLSETYLIKQVDWRYKEWTEVWCSWLLNWSTWTWEEN